MTVDEGYAFESPVVEEEEVQEEPKPKTKQEKKAKKVSSEESPQEEPTSEPDEAGEEVEQVVAEQEPSGDEITEPVEPEQAQPYSPEEIAELLETGKAYDIRRLTPEQQLFVRQVEKGLTPKLQEAAELKRRVQEYEQRERYAQTQPQQQPQVPADPLQQLIQAYDQNPAQVAAWLDQQYMAKKEEDPFAANDILLLKQNLMQQKQIKDAQLQTQQRAVNEVESKLQKEISGYSLDTWKELQKYAMDKHGYTEEEFWKQTNYGLGDLAVKNIKFFHKLYTDQTTKSKVEQELAKKKVPAKPTEVESPGSGFAPPKKEKFGDAEYADWRRKHTFAD